MVPSVWGAGWPDNFCGQIAFHFSLDNNSVMGRVNKTGIVVNSPPLIAGKVGLAYNFTASSSQYINFSDDPGFEFANTTAAASPMSITGWVLPRSTAANQAIVAKSNYAGNNNKTYEMYFSATSQGSGYVWDNAITGPPRIGKIKLLELTTGWHMYGMTYAGGNSTTSVRLQKDAVEQEATDDSSGAFIQMRDLDVSLVVGALSSLSFFADATLDEITFWNVNLSQSNFTYLYNSSNGVNLTGLCFNPVGNLLLSNFNVTNSYLNGTAWQTNTSALVFTRNATANVSFSLNTNGNCSISTLNQNNSAMIANDSATACPTTDSISQVCQLPRTKMLVRGNQSIYIACVTTGGTIENTRVPYAIQLDPVAIDGNTWNVTNAFINATAWRLSQNQTVVMRNRLPQVCFNTTAAGNCSLSRFNFNHTAMIANNSATACSDNNNITHCCNLPSNEALSNGDQFVYVGCRSDTGDTFGSTSGGLNMTMQRRIAGQIYIQVSNLSNYTYNSSRVFLVDNSTNLTVNITTANSTGGFEFWRELGGIFHIWGFDPTNSSVEGDVKNHIVVP